MNVSIFGKPELKGYEVITASSTAEPLVEILYKVSGEGLITIFMKKEDVQRFINELQERVNENENLEG